MIKEFEEWLVFNNKITGRKLSSSSAYKYARAIENISFDMLELGLFNYSFYINDSIKEVEKNIELIKSNDYFVRKDRIGHNMYSVALNHLICFLQDKH
ncbi:hypothetical protein RE628_01355 [Paenibacillus sp. D2_2]|uniref:hypothetical protein n=1 Tax=Paenibacillus sp. D2_2 TaxID=3073092 RepID=UPI0028168436|nr:hypothetical protein [Paenibacillus sp. D2_2]WMT41272.1 hypothetical protein RE628_01355 [Paenibacillus sp. D2_2]